MNKPATKVTAKKVKTRRTENIAVVHRALFHEQYMTKRGALESRAYAVEALNTHYADHGCRAGRVWNNPSLQEPLREPHYRDTPPAGLSLSLSLSLYSSSVFLNSTGFLNFQSEGCVMRSTGIVPMILNSRTPSYLVRFLHTLSSTNSQFKCRK